MAFGLEVQREEVQDNIILRLEGRLDTVTTPSLEKKVQLAMEEGHHKLLLDFSGVDYLSSAGMRLLLSTAKKLKAKGGKFVLFSLSDEVMEILKIAGFEKILAICKNEKEALQ